MESTQRCPLFFVCFKAMYILIIYQLKHLGVIILRKEVTTRTAYHSVQFSIIISRNVKSILPPNIY